MVEQERLFETEVNRRVEQRIIQRVRGQSSPPVNQAGLIQETQRTRAALQRSGELSSIRQQVRAELQADIQSGRVTNLEIKGSSLTPTSEQRGRTLTQQRTAETVGRQRRIPTRAEIFEGLTATTTSAGGTERRDLFDSAKARGGIRDSRLAGSVRVRSTIGDTEVSTLFKKKLDDFVNAQPEPAKIPTLSERGTQQGVRVTLKTDKGESSLPFDFSAGFAQKAAIAESAERDLVEKQRVADLLKSFPAFASLEFRDRQKRQAQFLQRTVGEPVGKAAKFVKESEAVKFAGEQINVFKSTVSKSPIGKAGSKVVSVAKATDATLTPILKSNINKFIAERERQSKKLAEKSADFFELTEKEKAFIANPVTSVKGRPSAAQVASLAIGDIQKLGRFSGRVEKAGVEIISRPATVVAPLLLSEFTLGFGTAAGIRVGAKAITQSRRLTKLTASRAGQFTRKSIEVGTNTIFGAAEVARFGADPAKAAAELPLRAAGFFKGVKVEQDVLGSLEARRGTFGDPKKTIFEQEKINKITKESLDKAKKELRKEFEGTGIPETVEQFSAEQLRELAEAASDLSALAKRKGLTAKPRDPTIEDLTKLGLTKKQAERALELQKEFKAVETGSGATKLFFEEARDPRDKDTKLGLDREKKKGKKQEKVLTDLEKAEIKRKEDFEKEIAKIGAEKVLDVGGLQKIEESFTAQIEPPATTPSGFLAQQQAEQLSRKVEGTIKFAAREVQRKGEKTVRRGKDIIDVIDTGALIAKDLAGQSLTKAERVRFDRATETLRQASKKVSAQARRSAQRLPSEPSVSSLSGRRSKIPSRIPSRSPSRAPSSSTGSRSPSGTPSRVPSSITKSVIPSSTIPSSFTSLTPSSTTSRTTSSITKSVIPSRTPSSITSRTPSSTPSRSFSTSFFDRTTDKIRLPKLPKRKRFSERDRQVSPQRRTFAPSLLGVQQQFKVQKLPTKAFTGLEARPFVEKKKEKKKRGKK